MAPVFSFHDYKIFLGTWLTEQPRGGRGLKSKLADSLRVRLAYLSRVLNGDAHLSPEQALRATHFLGLSSLEARCFRLLVDQARAGNSELREVVGAELAALRKSAASTKDRLHLDQPLTAEGEAEYYASWHVSAVHLALTIAGIDSREKLARALRLPIERVSQIVATLLRCGLVAERGGRLKVENQLMHGDPRSPNARRHLMNWRLRAIDATQVFEPENFHYSAIVSIARQDFDQIRTLLAEAIERAATVIKASPEECLAAINVDWFQLT